MNLTNASNASANASVAISNLTVPGGGMVGSVIAPPPGLSLPSPTSPGVLPPPGFTTPPGLSVPNDQILLAQQAHAQATLFSSDTTEAGNRTVYLGT